MRLIKGADGLMAAASTLSRPSDEFGNDSRVEALWAIKAAEHAEVYFNILCSVDPKQIPRLSPCDDQIYAKFRERFKGLEVGKINEDDLKSAEAKAEWRRFCDDFKDVEDFSFATLLRLDSAEDYSERNSIIVTKIQFYAVEIARNREGHNDKIKGNFKPTKRKAKKTSNEAELDADSALARGSAEMEHELKQILTGQHALLR